MLQRNTIYLRFYAEVVEPTAANAVAELIREKLNLCAGHVRIDDPKRYWKIDNYWGVFIRLQPSGSVLETFENILAALAADWKVHRFVDGGSWAVWNADTGSAFSIDQVRWAHVECGCEEMNA